MMSWESLFRQSRVNNGEYYGDDLPVQNWDWPRGTWFQERLRFLRRGLARRSDEFADEDRFSIQ